MHTKIGEEERVGSLSPTNSEIEMMKEEERMMERLHTIPEDAQPAPGISAKEVQAASRRKNSSRCIIS